MSQQAVLEAVAASRRLFDGGDVDGAARVLDAYSGERAADLQRGAVAAHAVLLDGRDAADAVTILTPHLDDPRALDLVGLSHYHSAITDRTHTLGEAVGECSAASRLDFDESCWKVDNTLHIGLIQQAQGSHDIAEVYLRDAHGAAEHCAAQRAFAAGALAFDARARGDDEAAWSLLEEALDIMRSIAVWLPSSLVAMADASKAAHPEAAAKLVDEAVEIARGLRVRQPLAVALTASGAINGRRQDLTEALDIAIAIGDLALRDSVKSRL